MQRTRTTLATPTQLDEICTCGHTRRQHEQAYAACLEPCLCSRFTWDASNPANAELQRARITAAQKAMD